MAHAITKRFALLLALGCVSIAPAVHAEEARREAGVLHVVTYRPGPAWRAGVPMRQQGLGPHAAYMQGLLDRGALFAAGGFETDNGGMALLLVSDEAEARAIVAADPAVTSGIFVAQVEAWRPRFISPSPLGGTGN